MRATGNGSAMDCVVGSGPAGVACAAALLKRGRRVLMLDAGLQLEPDRAQVVQRLARQTPAEWDPADVARIQEGMAPKAGGIPQKLCFGSDYPYRDTGPELGLRSERSGLQASLAQGGLSSVWGSAMMPYAASELRDWPITLEQLAPHYRAVLELTGISAGHDGLTERFPLFTKTPGQLEMSQQAQALWHQLSRHAAALEQRGVSFGRARVAIQARQAGGREGCIHCGYCLYGCPYGYIFNSANVVAAWTGNPGFTYQPDIVVESVREQGETVVVQGHRRGTQEPFTTEVARVYLAAGVIPTTGILLRSLDLRDTEVTLKDSQYFLLPALLTQRVTGVRVEKLHTLSQIFVELLDPKVSANTVHLQLYTYNDLIGRTVQNLFGPLKKPLDFLARELENRLVLFQGFVHSDDSSRMAIALRRTAQGEQLELTPQVNPQARRVVGKIVRRLLRHSLRLGAVPLPPMLQFAQPGRSFHAGGSFPMQTQPGRLATDTLGRPAGWQRVHAVDATVFPSIAATTITFTAMANAHRIATETPAA